MLPSSPISISAEIVIPAERVIRELQKNAQPGFFGQVEIQLGLSPDALKGVVFIISRQQKIRSTDKPVQVGAAEGDTEREKIVEKVVSQLSDVLKVKLTTLKLVTHFQDGELKNCEIVDESRQQLTV